MARRVGCLRGTRPIRALQKQKPVNPRGTDPTEPCREGQRKHRRNKSKSHLSHQRHQALATCVAKFAYALRHNQVLKAAIQPDPRGLRADLLGLVRAQFPVRRGRHSDPRIDAACEMVRKGKTVQQSLKAQIPSWRNMDPYTRMLAAKGLHHARATPGCIGYSSHLGSVASVYPGREDDFGGPRLQPRDDCMPRHVQRGRADL